MSRATEGRILRNNKAAEPGPPIQRPFQLRGEDLNLRPSGYEPDELPGCSTARHVRLPGQSGQPSRGDQQGQDHPTPHRSDPITQAPAKSVGSGPRMRAWSGATSAVNATPSRGVARTRFTPRGLTRPICVPRCQTSAGHPRATARVRGLLPTGAPHGSRAHRPPSARYVRPTG